VLRAYAGDGELLATREAWRSLPRSLYGALLATMLSRTARHADALHRLLPRVWMALLGGAYLPGDFACDETGGWGAVREPLLAPLQLRPASASPTGGAAAPVPDASLEQPGAPGAPSATPSATPSAALGVLKGLLPLVTHSPHSGDPHAAATALALAPDTPSARERASGCSGRSMACLVVAVHKESLDWLQSEHLRQFPTLTYYRTVSAAGLYVMLAEAPRPMAADGLPECPHECLPASLIRYVVPNVFHEHAVYLRYICAFYNDLPKLSVFLHGHHTSWHNTRSSPAAEKLRQMDLRAAAAKGDVYRSFNDFQECWRDGHGEWEAEMLAQRHGWAREMVGALGQPPRLKEAYCCTQFIVSADRIRRRPLRFWRQLLADLLDGEVPPVCKVSGHVLELTWGYMLGEPPDAMCRTDGWGHAGAPGEPTPQGQRLGDATQKPQ